MREGEEKKRRKEENKETLAPFYWTGSGSIWKLG
jgi:hypothetical protein